MPFNVIENVIFEKYINNKAPTKFKFKKKNTIQI